MNKKPEFLYKNGFVYLLNVGLFSLIYMNKPTGAVFMVGVLLVLLLVSFFFLKQNYSEQFIKQVKEVGKINVNAGVLLILFIPLTFMHWWDFALNEQAYMLVFCCLQILMLRIPDSA